MNEKSNNKGLYVVIGTLCVAIVALTIAYAALSSNLQINFGSVTQSVQSWNVSFVKTSADTAVPSAGNNTISATTQAGDATCGTATLSQNSVEIAATTISKPGDKCIYTLYVKNLGSINAILNSITPSHSGVTCETAEGAVMQCGNIKYRLTSDAAGTNAMTETVGGEVQLKNDGTLNSGSVHTMYLVAEYDTGVTTLNNGSAITQSNIGFTLNYTQN